MKRTAILVAALLLVLVLATSSFGAPRLTIPDASFDFGYVPQNSSISHEFWLYSEGDDSLKILKVIPG
ncbi:MAG: DUF1573 domain-containing protein [candidate division Zixibacteria bacterium]|nr:DUF1573 domain-containing protein [candidate division Zixibacteria bacterium]